MKRHPLDILSLLLGIVFLLFALAYLLGDVTGSIPGMQITIPLLLAGLGVAGVVGAIAAQQRSDAEAATLPVGVATDQHPEAVDPVEADGPSIER